MLELSTALLTWTKDSRLFTGDASEATRGGKIPLTRSIRVTNPNTGGSRVFELSRTERDRENELVAYHFTSPGRTTRGTLTLTLFND